MDTLKFGQFIAERRRELGLKQQELAQKLNVTDKAVSRWENGRGFPDINTLEPLAEALGVSVVELMKSERLGEPLTPETADTALTDTIEMAGIETKRNRVRTVFMVFAAIIGSLLILLLGWQIWGYNNPEITIGFAHPVGSVPQHIQELMENYDGSEGEWISVGPWKHHYRSIPMAGISERSVFGKSKTWTIRLLRWHMATEYYVNESYRLAEEEPYIFLGRIDVVDGETWFTRLGYYTEDGVTKPLYDVITFDFTFESYENLSDSLYNMVWLEFLEVKEAWERKMTTAEWEEWQKQED